MRRKSNSGFYLSRKAVAFFGFLILVLLLVLTVLAILYGKLRVEKAHYFSTTWEPPSTDWEPLAPGRQVCETTPVCQAVSFPAITSWSYGLIPGQKQLGEFLGQVNVTVRCKEETGIILLHSQQLRYSGLGVSAGGTEPRSSPAIRDTWLEVQNDYLVIELNDTLVPGQDYIIQADYSGLLEEKLTGLFVGYTRNGVLTRVIYCIWCSCCGLLYSGETGRRLGDRLIEHLGPVCRISGDLPVATHFNSCPFPRRHVYPLSHALPD